jgi:hypothetical protein
MIQPTRRMLIRSLVLVILGYYAFQTLLVAKQDEPYPGLMMPRFSWEGPQQSDGFDTKEADAVFSYTDGTSRSMPLAQVLAAVPEGHRYTMMENLFAPLEPIDQRAPVSRAPLGKREPPLWLFPGYALGRGSRYQSEHQRSLAVWLGRRARAVYPAADPALCTVIWYQAKYRANQQGDPVRASRVVAGRFEVELH